MPPTGSPRLPPEICDQVLDCLAPTYSLPEKIFWTRTIQIRTLVACIRVSRQWLPRARIHLYHEIWFSRAEAMLGLIATLTEQPTFASLIHTVYISPAGWGYTKETVKYFPLPRLLAVHPRLKHLYIEKQDIGCDYPTPLMARLGHHTSIGRLTLHEAKFSSLPELLRLIRSFQSLDTLSLTSVRLNREPSTEVIDRLCAQRPCWTSPLLRSLEVKYLPAQILHLLGSDLTEFSFHEFISPPVSGYYPDRLAFYQHLTTLHVNLDTPLGPPRDTAEARDDPDCGFSPLVDYFLAISLAIKSLPLRSLEFRVTLNPRYMAQQTVPSVSGAKRTPTCWRYLHTRDAVMDAVIGRALRYLVLSHPASPTLSLLSVGVTENTGTDSAIQWIQRQTEHKQDWWKPRIAQRLAGVHLGAIGMDIRPCRDEDGDQNYSQLWELDPQAIPAWDDILAEIYESYSVPWDSQRPP